MSYKALLIQPDGSHEFREINDYTDIHKAVGGSFDMTAPGPVLYSVYEWSLYERPVNPLATAMYRATHLTEDKLCGPVLVEGPASPQGDGTDVPESFMRTFLRLKKAMAQEEIDAQAVPLSAEEREEIQRQTIVAQAKATEALNKGMAVDFGGIMLGRGSIDAGALDFGTFDPGDGQHRHGGRS